MKQVATNGDDNVQFMYYINKIVLSVENQNGRDELAERRAAL